jgi:serine/threonine protein kinase
MAPEVIACDYGPADYDHRCDIWSVGIVAIELAQGKPPLTDIPPLSALTKIPANPAPTLAKCSTNKHWSQNFHKFVTCALVKDVQKVPPPPHLQLSSSPFYTTSCLSRACALSFVSTTSTIYWLAITAHAHRCSFNRCNNVRMFSVVHMQQCSVGLVGSSTFCNHS